MDFLNRYAMVEGMLKGITVEEYGRVMKKEGLEEGRSEGLAEGEASGRAEREIEMAKAMRLKSYSVDKSGKVE